MKLTEKSQKILKNFIKRGYSMQTLCRHQSSQYIITLEKDCPSGSMEYDVVEQSGTTVNSAILKCEKEFQQKNKD
jgi:hypothetical protein